MNDPLLELKDLTVKYETNEGLVTAVSNASFTVEAGNYQGLVGESGCGKSTLAKAIIGALDNNGVITSGEIIYDEEPIHDLSEKQLNEEIRWEEIAWIPQGSMESLDPVIKIRKQAQKIGQAHTNLSNNEIVEKLEEMFEVVGLQKERVNEYPHQFSGGMQQRAIIALSLFLEPSFLIADEPTTALDVIMQDQIFKYLDRIREKLDVSMLLITHDISLIFETCDELAVMHGGQIAESGDVLDVFDNPTHPYSIALQKAFPDIRYPKRALEVIEGYPPKTTGEVDYCTFYERCPWASEKCENIAPNLENVPQITDHFVACHHKEEVIEETHGDIENE